jgi:hypothetical protein
MNPVVVGVNPMPERFIQRFKCGYFLNAEKLLADASEKTLNLFFLRPPD